MKVTLLCLATISQFILSSMADSIHRIPLYRKRTEDPDFISTPANDLANGMLGGMIEIGNPPQKFIVAFDTSTGFSWVTSNRCTSENCQGRRSYNAEESSTAVDVGIDFKVDYGTEGISSTLYLDTLRFAGITIEEMPFGSAYQMSGFTQGFDGFLGLGRNVNLNKSEIHYAKRDIPASGFIPNSYQQSSSIRSAQFGMYVLSYGGGFSETGYVSSHYYSNSVTSGGFGYLKRNYRKDKDEPAGYLILGGVDTEAIKGELYYIDVADNYESGNWAVPVKAAGFVDDLTFKVKKEARAILSSTTDVIGLPNKHAKQFQEKWYAEYDKKDNTFMIPCCLMDRLTAFKIRLGDIHVTLPPHYWSYKTKATSCCEMCRTHIGKSNSGTDYIIGSSLTNAFYLQYDSENDRVGIAMKKCDPKDGLKLCRSAK